MAGTPGATGAYGFRITGVEIGTPPLNEVAPDAPEITVIVERSKDSATHKEVSDSRVVLPLVGGGEARMITDPPGAVLATPQPITPAAVAHPYLAPVAAVHAHWRNWLPIHAGGIVLPSGVWGVTGPRSSGKSSFVAACALRRIPVVADDLLVLDDARVHPGPRSVDLRPDAARQLGTGVDMGILGMRERWRVEIPPVGALPPFAGWIFLTWGPEVWIGEVPVRDRVSRLRSKNAVPGLAPLPAAFLRAAAMPCFTLHRPREWARLDSAIDLLMNRLG